MEKFIFNKEIYETFDDAADAVRNFAYETFNEYLDDCFEEIRIGNLTYRPSVVLKSTDPTAYRCMLCDYENYLQYDIEEVEDDEDTEEEEDE